MGRKFLFLSITLTTIIFGSSLASTASAEPDSEYWTLEEMAELSEASFAEAKELCEDSNSGCWQKYLRDRRARGGIYEALDSYEYPKLIITSVNPTSGKIKLIYYNENKRSRYLGKEEDPATLHSIYIGRIDGESDINYSPWNDIENIVNNRETARNIYMTFRWDFGDENHVELLPNIEQEFDAENLELATNINNSFYYILEDSNSRYLELYRLSDCLANYQEGTECQIRYSKDGEVYIPVSAETTSSPVGTDDNHNDGHNNTQDDIQDNPVNSIENSIENTDEVSSDNFLSQESTHLNPTPQILNISAPNTGAPTSQTPATPSYLLQAVIVLLTGGVTFLCKIVKNLIFNKKSIDKIKGIR